jgi:DNA invertase Pin-like site-specific DNA recombinase
MELEVRQQNRFISPQAGRSEEGAMVRREVWEEIRRRHRQEGVPIRELSRHFRMDRNTVRRCIRQEKWRPYTRALGTDTLLAPHVSGNVKIHPCGI